MNPDTTRVVAVMALWASCYPLITLGLDDAPHLTFAAMRAVLASGVLLSVAFYLRLPIPREPRLWMWLAIAGFGTTTLGYLGMFHAAEYVAPGFATIITNTQPLLAAILAYFVLQEHLGTRARIGLLIGFLGVVVAAAPQLTGGDAGATVKGIAFILLAAIGVSIGNVAIKRIASAIAPTSAMGWQLLIGAAPLVVFAAATEDPGAISWTPDFLFSLIGLSLFGTALAFWLWQTALTKMDLSRANAFSFLVPFLGISFGAMFFGEPVTLNALGGAALAVIGVRLVLARSSKIGPQHEP
ncbi:DMT family transporter [Marinicaulis aureus]|uniref:DMT family transporter n=1 Tax=Hyphococcus aureus TaxID=2666033 RepID=A0ABW1L4D3_9PROT